MSCGDGSGAADDDSQNKWFAWLVMCLGGCVRMEAPAGVPQDFTDLMFYVES